MSRKRKYKQSPTQTTSTQDATIFTFGEPESVLDGAGWLLDYLYCANNGKWYEPPVSLAELSKTTRAAVHHSSPLNFKRNLLSQLFIPNDYLSEKEFRIFAHNYLTLGNAYLQRVNNRLGGLLRLRNMPAINTRRALNQKDFYFLSQSPTGSMEEQVFDGANIYHLKEDDLDQEIYGVPEYLAALNSVLLNEAATVFRRRYYKNGSHAGFILYLTDPKLDPKDAETLRKKLKESKGIGNFRNLFLHAPDGDKDGIRLIPIAEVAAKDEFAHIKNITRDDALAAHRVPPQLLGIMPNSTGGFGDIEKAAGTFYFNEIRSLQSRFNAVNE